MFRNSLKRQLFVSSVIAVILTIFLIILALHGYKALTVILAVLLAAFIVSVNVWFEHSVSKPIQSLTEVTRDIADGSYGTKVPVSGENEIAQLGKAINRMSVKIAESDKTTTEFISQISHELRTPLTAIIGWTDSVLKEDAAIQGYSRKGVEIISSEAGRLEKMVNGLLEFTRIQGNRFTLRLETLDVGAELEDALFTYGQLMKDAGVELHYTQPDEDVPLINGDPERLKQVFLNLLDNAIKYGGGKSIEVDLSASAEHILISVRDHGPGIPTDELPHVKEKFYKGSSKSRGSGIGLAVCEEIVSRHDGKLTIANADGGGCIVTIRLPVIKDKR